MMEWRVYFNVCTHRDRIKPVCYSIAAMEFPHQSLRLNCILCSEELIMLRRWKSFFLSPFSEQQSRKGEGQENLKWFSPCFVTKRKKRRRERKGQDKNISQSCTLVLGQIKSTPGQFVPCEDDNRTSMCYARHRHAEISSPRIHSCAEFPPRWWLGSDPRCWQLLKSKLSLLAPV